jgi:putative membrane protein
MALGPGETVYPFDPYCGRPPDVTDIWSRWNLDPALLAGLLAIGAAAAFLASEKAARSGGDRRQSAARRTILVAGWALTALALVSPLCALSVSLFSARIAQHMLLACVAAPLVVMGMPRARLRADKAQFPAAACFAAMLWLWHLPGPYAATFNGPLVYWAMHLTMFAAALWFWKSILQASRERLAAVVGASLFTSLQMAFLGAIITFAGRPLYAPHEFTTFTWGLTPLQDQQLGGAVMWVPAGAVFVAAILLPLEAVMRQANSRA